MQQLQVEVRFPSQVDGTSGRIPELRANTVGESKQVIKDNGPVLSMHAHV